MKCSECGTEPKKNDGPHCLALEKRQGPRVTDSKHPSNSGEWARVMALPMKVSGPFFIAPPKDVAK